VLSRVPASLFWSALWALLLGTALLMRPPLPMDETRYLAVAWDMWLSDNYLVPHLNGETYSHKPPLLFWLMNLGWGVFGVHDWWPRLVAPLFGLGCLFLTRRLARELWPSADRVHDLAPLVLLGCGFWTLFTTLTMFDTILAFCTLLGLIGIVSAWRRGGIAGFIILGLAIGLGALTKGPAILLHLLPIALSAPYWAGKLAGAPSAPLYGWGRWYLGVFAALFIGVAIGLVWAIPAGIAGGEEYRNAIFWGQTAGRMVKSFAHQREWWWYLAVMPGLIVPWLVWPPLWRSLRHLKSADWLDGGLRFCLIWFGFAFIVFSLISGKQLHYLLPEFPALVLVMTYSLLRLPWAEGKKLDQMVPGLLIIIIGAALCAAPYAPLSRKPEWLPLVENGWGLAVIAIGLWISFVRSTTPELAVRRLMLAPVIIVLAVHLAARPVLSSVYDLEPLALQLKDWEDQGIPLANFGKYHGQFNFLGRLTKPVVPIGHKPGQQEAFLTSSSNGRIVAYYRNVPDHATPVKTYKFRQNTVVIWEARDLIADPHLGDKR